MGEMSAIEHWIAWQTTKNDGLPHPMSAIYKAIFSTGHLGKELRRSWTSRVKSPHFSEDVGKIPVVAA